MALVGAPSRFSVLKVDVSDPRERKRPQADAAGGSGANANKNAGNNAKNKQQQQQQQQHKKNKKKDNNNNTNNNNNNNNSKKKSQHPAPGNANHGDQEKFDQWKKRDEELVEDLYEKELQEALLRSRLEQGSQDQALLGRSPPGDGGASGRKGKVTLSLAEFHEKFHEDPCVPSPAVREPLSKVLANMKHQEEEEDALRKQTAREATAIMTRERVSEELRERAQQPRVVSQEEFDQMLEMKRKQIEHMAKVLNQTHKEMAILQEQNRDLEAIVSKGEMKKKTDLIRELEELRLVKDELTEQIGVLHASLEQEKSKVHQLTLELQKKR